MKAGTLVADRYRCARLLGRGGMGEVHAALDLRTDRRVAVKLMLGHRLDSADARARFDREARVGARIASPYLVEVHDAGVDPDTDTPYLVMELLEGEDLQHRLARDGRRPAAEVIALLGQLALALADMATERVVHRDLKPSNLFLQTRRGEPPRLKVLDLGVAKELSDATGPTTGIAGTPTYMAPEQISGGALSPATDLHALGLIAFTLLAGAPYWSKDPGEEPIALAIKMRDGPLEPATVRAGALGVELPAAFDAWFARATARRPERRFPSAIAAVHALAAALAVEAPPWLPDAAGDDREDRDRDHLDRDHPDDRDGAASPESPTVTAQPYTPSPPRPVAPAPAPASTGAIAAPASAAAAPGVEIAPPTAAIRHARWRPRVAWVLALGAAAAATGFALRPAPGPAPSPLAAPDTVLACPILAVDGAVAAEGWLGAAAASLACERARVLLGGRPSRTRLPAELLRLPARPGDDFPVDPYGAPDARARTRAAARAADAYLDGRVHRQNPGFRVELALHRWDRAVLASATGTGVALEQAVRNAMAPLVASGQLPTARVPDLVVADHARAWTIAGILDFLDLQLAFKNNAGQVPDLCDALARRHGGADATDRVRFARYECDHTLGLRSPPLVLSDPVTTLGAETTTARLEYMDRRPDAAKIPRLTRAYDQERSSWSRALIASTLSCLYEAVDATQVPVWAQRAVQDEAKNPTGEWCAPWDQLRTVDPRPAAFDVMQAWEPWHAYAWFDGAQKLPLAYVERAYLLSPFDTEVASAYAERLISLGRREDARTVAIAVAGGGQPVHAIESGLLLARIAAAATRFGEALAAARAAMQVQPTDAGWILPQRLHAAAFAVELAAVVGRATEVADAAVAALVDTGPASIAGVHVDELWWLATVCAYASPARAAACFARLDALRPAADDSLTAATAYATGARHYAAGDLPAAAAAWQPLVKDDQYRQLAEAMVVAFAAAGDHAVVAKIAAHRDDDTLGGASMALARAALAARDRGDRAGATRLAAAVIAGWSEADLKPPILDELRRLVP